MSQNQSGWPHDERTERDIQKLHESLDRLEQKLDRIWIVAAYAEEHERMLCGTEHQPGMRIRLDRVEQTLKRFQNYLTIIGSAIGAMALDLLHRLLKFS